MHKGTTNISGGTQTQGKFQWRVVWPTEKMKNEEEKSGDLEEKKKEIFEESRQ